MAYTEPMTLESEVVVVVVGAVTPVTEALVSPAFWRLEVKDDA